MSQAAETRQFSTFLIADQLYGIDVMKVQEITRALPMTKVPLAPPFVYGLINLRGQISTAIGLRELFGIKGQVPEDPLNVVCRLEEVLASFLVDRIGDVIEVSMKDFEPVPETVPEETRRYIEGIYKIPGFLLSVVDVNKISTTLMKYQVADNGLSARAAVG